MAIFVHVEDAQNSAVAYTDEQGEYTLDFGVGTGGAYAGKYKVRISTYNEGNPDADPPLPCTPETVPARYNVESILTAEVKPLEQNPINFALESGGRIDQPRRTARGPRRPCTRDARLGARAFPPRPRARSGVQLRGKQSSIRHDPPSPPLQHAIG